MNPDRQKFLTDEWQPPERDIRAITLFGSETAEIAIRGSPDTGIKTDEILHLEDNR